LRYDYQLGAESQLQQGHYDQALELYRQALELAPEDAELNLAIGVLYEALQQPDNATRQYTEAEKRYPTRAAFLTARAQKYMQLSWYDRAVEQALAATALDERYALAQCTLGSAYQGLGENNDAIAALWVCSDLANEQGQDELYVHAKMLLANLMQQPS
jgi:tetratricopeptide (TPR) repeat protein